MKLARTGGGDDHTAGEPVLRPVELWDLVSAFARLMRETQALQSRTIHIDDTPQEVYERQIVAKARETGQVPFRELFTPPYFKSKLIGLFLAILELIKRGAITLEQPEAFGEIMILAVPTATP